MIHSQVALNTTPTTHITDIHWTPMFWLCARGLQHEDRHIPALKSLTYCVVPCTVYISPVQSLSHVWLFATPWTAAARLPCPSPTHGACSNSCTSSLWRHLTISSSVICFSSCLQSFPASGSFQMSQFFASGGQSIGVSASASVLPMNIQQWIPLGSMGLVSLLSKGLSRIFSNTTIQRHQFFSAQFSL